MPRGRPAKGCGKKVSRSVYLTPEESREFDRMATFDGPSAYLLRLFREDLERDRKAQRKASKTVEAGV